ncbi:general amino-acid permease GAP1 [Uncinocarpus reesii 1704]|uniref:General amino-acid permease GAP1 n=1 Tax=Uncinocarpus reesii (strain UAMH 1704) TaxID=336963 RepID=C4JIN9_UNCRE|nr:general amino-acid permease GAP1 [Uncinocarpus reesii 1704]EEP78051.1 general amino-acid permease GAP1 [Uncinocarpus reesii 1704]
MGATHKEESHIIADAEAMRVASWDEVMHKGPKANLARRIIDGFKRDPKAFISQPLNDKTGFDAEGAAAATAASPLKRKLKSRHLQMIAIGGSIGTGLFVGSGKSLATGGPASVVIAFCLIGIMLYATIHALGELAVMYPVAGAFAHYSTRFLDPAWGFAMGWNYAILWLTLLPLEIVAAAITVGYWEADVSPAAWVSMFYVLIVVINLFGVLGYGEAEFVFSIIKVIAVIGFIILGIVLNCGGGPNGDYIGGKFWHDPGAFNNGFKGLCSVFVTAAFTFGGGELVGLAAAETANPRKSIPTAVKQVFWRIVLFYIVSMIIVGLLVPYTDPQLLNGSSTDVKASPFVIAIQRAGITGLDSVMNAVIMISVLSVGNAAIYGSSRTLTALAEQHQAPAFLAYIDRKGRPLMSIIVASLLGLLGFLAATPKQQDAFMWMLAISGLSSVFTWASICLAHIRFRRGWKLQGRTLDELPFRAQGGVFTSWIGFAINIIVLVAQFWTALAPIGYGKMSSSERVKYWFSTYLAAPIVLTFYIYYKLRYRTSIVRAKDMDLDTGRRDLNLQHLIAEEKAEYESWPRWKKVYKAFC